MYSIQRAEQEKERIFEVLYLLLLGVYVIISFKDTTQIPIQWPDSLISAMRILGALVILAKAAVGKRWSLGKVLLCCAVCGCLMGSWSVCHRTYILELAILIAGAYSVPFRKIVQVSFAVSLSCLLLTMALTGLGLVENLIYYRPDGKMRMAFGSIYPTDFTAHVFYIAAMYCWLRGRRISYGEIGILVVLAFFCYWFCDARLNVICLLLLAGGMLYVKQRRKQADRRQTGYEMHKILQGILCMAMPLCAAGIFGLTAIYAEENSLTAWLDTLLSNRLRLSLEGFQQYPITWFGQDITMWGLGGTTEVPETYFFLDSSYVNILLTMGITVFVSVLLIFVLGALRQRRMKRWEQLGILAVIAVQCVIEHHLLQISYHPFLLMLLAVEVEEGGFKSKGGRNRNGKELRSRREQNG